jgi:hypothetical protein
VKPGFRWPVVAAIVGGLTSAIFSGLLHWSREAFVGVWLVVAGLTLAAWVTTGRWSPAVQLRRRRVSGLLVGLVAGALLAVLVARQPASAAPAGGAAVGPLLWLGLVYGTVDALMLNVLPVLSLYGARPATDLQGVARLRWAGVALLGSLLVTAAYHVGFAEFRGSALLQPLIGNLIITLTYLLSGSPLAPVAAHVIMHAAAVLHGAATTSQLPPHY